MCFGAESGVCSGQYPGGNRNGRCHSAATGSGGKRCVSTVALDQSALLQSPELDRSLEQVPGLSLFRRDSSLSANPTAQGVSLREIAPSGASRALVTLDGVPQNDPFGGWVIWSALPAEDIARGQIVRGAGAGPYGAGALTGVIALNEQEGQGIAAADLSAGEFGTRRAAAAGGIDAGKFSLFASASDESSVAGFLCARLHVVRPTII